MGRYRGPVCRLCRRHGEKLMLKGARCSTPKCALERKGMPPGEHGRRRRKVSERGLQLKEKQKARHIYGVLERQFWNYFTEAERHPGLTGENLLRMLEMRLDNVVYRLGFADSRNQARQLVQHGHITLNGHKTDIPSCLVKVGDVISWKELSTRLKHYEKVAQDIENKSAPGWLSLDTKSISGRVLTLPNRSDIDSTIDDRTIVEYYAR